jgi:cell division initiation protein
MDDSNAQPTPQLLTDIQFKVARKGYDPGEVDAFLERLSGAVGQMQDRLRQANAAAEAADRRAAEATRAQALLQARVTELESGAATAPAPASAVGPEAEVEQAATVLAMAQRTADAVVNDARTAAAKLLSDAEAEAANIVGDARATAAASIGDLDARRRELEADAAALDAFLQEQRAAISADVSRIQTVLDDPRALRVGALPASIGEVHGSSEPEEAVEEVAVPSSDLPTMATPTVEVTEAAEAEVPQPEAPAVTPLSKVFDAEEIVEVDEETRDGGRLFDETDDAADEAMRRFFDADFEDDDRFGR